MHHIHRLPQFPQHVVHVHKFTSVSNSSTIKTHLIDGNTAYDFAFIDARNVISEEQLMSAVYRALLDHTNDKIRTKTVHSEIIFSLSPTQNIGDALRRFGIQDDSKDVIVVKIEPEVGVYDLGVVEGEEVEPTNQQFLSTVDLKSVRKVCPVS